MDTQITCSFINRLFKRFKRLFKFSLSSFSAFLVDYALYSIILAIGSYERITFISLTFANIVARVVSSTVNFTINRKLVFKSEKQVHKSAIEFFTLAAIILLGNSLVLNFLVTALKINHYLAKILTEMTFFLVNFTVQTLVIFKNKEE